ncbi:hypothetical protein Mp_6g07630 [Marchantia polymorpha subsp. ruderalis]|nr:hypothetical protein MARPO_0053s0076 [Marchantia polymorpha]BBN13941.1 hypothetical protein Mp_6g07630 [Marchantia polymorpha subsp. ruderalis]|eukprot:PTQ38142.1 hypothetical protein MARPO_0053s0076 [Marchantia polymorpha]
MNEEEELESKLETLNHSIEPLEQELARASPTKHKAVNLVEQSLIAENELRRLKTEITPVSQLSHSEAREAMIFQIRQDNAEISKAEEKRKLLEAEIKTLEDKLVAAETVLSELKGGRADKFMEMQEKDRKMQSFIDDYENMRRERTEKIRTVKEKIDLLLEHVDIDCSDSGDRINNEGTQDIEGLTQDLDERKRELKQLEEMDLKTRNEISSCRQKIACSQAEIEKFSRLDELRAASESKCSRLEDEKRVTEGKTLSAKVQSKEQTMKLELLQQHVNESPVHKNLEILHQTLLTIQQSICKAQEDLDAREKDLNYTPVLENIRFMVAQLNGEIKSAVLH